MFLCTSSSRGAARRREGERGKPGADDKPIEQPHRLGCSMNDSTKKQKNKFFGKRCLIGSSKHLAHSEFRIDFLRFTLFLIVQIMRTCESIVCFIRKTNVHRRKRTPYVCILAQKHTRHAHTTISVRSQVIWNGRCARTNAKR